MCCSVRISTISLLTEKYVFQITVSKNLLSLSQKVVSSTMSCVICTTKLVKKHDNVNVTQLSKEWLKDISKEEMTSFQQFIDKMLYIEFTKPDTWLITLILDYYPEHVNDVFFVVRKYNSCLSTTNFREFDSHWQIICIFHLKRQHGDFTAAFCFCILKIIPHDIVEEQLSDKHSLI